VCHTGQAGYSSHLDHSAQGNMIVPLFFVMCSLHTVHKINVELVGYVSLSICDYWMDFYEILKVTAEWFALQLCMLEVLGSDLGPQFSYPDWGFLWLSSVPSCKFWDSMLN
jgi:hypothetical protein